MLKKIKLVELLFVVILIINLIIFPVLADDIEETVNDENNEIIETSASQDDNLVINSRSVVVIDRNSNTILFGKNENSKRKMASTTKIMTCLIVLENSNLQDTVTISKKSAGTGGSRLGLKTDDKITVCDLLYGLMLCSGNDTAVALAEHVGGSVENFAKLMNTKAKELGLENTNFVTPHGLDSEDHYTTAFELALLTNYALKNDTFAKIVGTKSYQVTINGYPKTITNTNELLGNLQGVYGVKTGFTNGANRCLVTACKRNNLDIICVVLGADTKKFRSKDSIKLIEYTFKTFNSVNIEAFLNNNFKEWQNNNLNSFKIIKGKNQNIKLKLSSLKSSTLPIDKKFENSLTCNIVCKKELEAPLNKEDCIGFIEIICNNESIYKVDILLDCNIEKMKIINYFYDFWKNYNNLYKNLII